MNRNGSYAVIVPLANEEKDFEIFTQCLVPVLRDFNISGYLVVDNASKDNTRKLCEDLSKKQPLITTIYEPSNKNVVDAYLAGYRAAWADAHDFIIEMDAGLSHDPLLLPKFIKAYQNGYDCVYGSRFLQGGEMNSSVRRLFFSKSGTILANFLLGTRLSDMTSGFQGFEKNVVKALLHHPFRSTAHFYQTEVRYLLRHLKSIEIPISYQLPSGNVPFSAIANSLSVLSYYFFKRLMLKPKSLTRT